MSVSPHSRTLASWWPSHAARGRGSSRRVRRVARATAAYSRGLPVRSALRHRALSERRGCLVTAGEGAGELYDGDGEHLRRSEAKSPRGERIVGVVGERRVEQRDERAEDAAGPRC